MALEESGLRLTAEGGNEFESTLRGANDAVEGFGQAASRAASPLDAFGEIATGALRRVGEIAVNALGAAAGAVGGFISDSFAGALEAEQTLTRISSVIESTGNAAGLSVSDVERLGNQFAHLAGGSDDAVLAIQEMALRLGTISAEEMPDFIQTTLDMAAATGVDAVAAARTLAVAQEDPISALGRLRKSGILLTEAQEEQIKSMVKAGDSAGAYALLIEQVGVATGGAALANSQTLAGQMEIFKNTIGEAGESIATAFLPILTQLFQNVIGPAVPVITSMANSIGALAIEFINFMTGVSDGSDLFGELFDLFGPETATAIFSILEGFQNLGLTFQQAGMQIMESLEPLQVALGELFTAIFGQMPPAQSIIETVMGAISNAVTVAADFISGTLVPALTSAVEWVTANWPTIQATIETVMNKVSEVVNAVLSVVVPFVVEKFGEIKGWVDENWPLIQATIETVINTIDEIIRTVVGGITTFWTEQHGEMDSVGTTVWENIKLTVSESIGNIGATLKAGMQIITGDWDGAWTTISTALSDNWTFIKGQTQESSNLVEGIIRDVMGRVQAWWSEVWTGIQTKLGEIWAGMVSAVQEKIAALIAPITQRMDALDPEWRTKWEAIKVALAEKWDAMVAAVTEKITAIWTAITTKLGEIKATFDRILGEILGAVGLKFGEVEDTTNTTIENMKQAFLNAIGPFIQLGSDIIDGIRQGVLNAAGALADAAAQAAIDAFNAAAGWLGAHSPSERTAEGIGRPFAEGIAEGIGRGTTDVVDAARDIAEIAVETAGRAVSDTMAEVNPWAAILGGPGYSAPDIPHFNPPVVATSTALGRAAVIELGRATNQAMNEVNPWAAILGGGATSIFGMLPQVIDAARTTGQIAVEELGRAINETTATIDPWAAIFGTGGAGGSVFGPGTSGDYNFGFGGGPTTGQGGGADFGFGGGPVTAPPADSFGFGGGPVSGPPISGGPTLGGGPIEGGGGGSITVNIDATGASPTQTQAAVTRALRDAGQYSDTRLRLRGAM